MKVRFWDAELGSVPESAPRDSLEYLVGKRSCGILWFRGAATPDLELHIHDGRVVNCIGGDDEALLTQLLVSSSLGSEPQLEELAERSGRLWLAEALVETGVLATQVIQPIRVEIVRDQIFRACVTEWQVIEFEENAPTFEPDLLPSLDLREILSEVQGWSSRVRPLQALVADGHDAVIERRADVDAKGAEQRIVLNQIRGAVRYSEALLRAPLARYRTMVVLVSLVTCGAIAIFPAGQ